MIRLALQSDAERIAEIDAELFPGNAFSRQQVYQEIVDYKGFSWVEECAGDVVGYAIARPQGDLLDLLRLGVRSEYQGHGIDAELLAFVVKSSPVVMLTVQKNNRAIKFYLRHDLRIVGDLGDAWVMKLTLDAA